MTGTDGTNQKESLRVVFNVGDHDTFVQMVETLNEEKVPFQIKVIGRKLAADPRQVTVNLDKVTDRQRQAVEIALENGYYEQPRNTDLAELAEKMDISKSAISQRLRAAETKLVKNAFGEY